MTNLVTCLDTVAKPISCFEVSIKEPIPKFQKLPHAYIHVLTDSVTHMCVHMYFVTIRIRYKKRATHVKCLDAFKIYVKLKN